jgi:hypothetical protein
VSGTQKWKGTAAVLKAKPTRVRTTPAWASVCNWSSTFSILVAISVRYRVPVDA